MAGPSRLRGGGAWCLQEGLLPIPNALLNDSLLLGGITKATLGPSGAQSLFVHPYVIGGWCGLVATALNCLPVGCLDGGRIMQARAPDAGAAVGSTCPLWLHARL